MLVQRLPFQKVTFFLLLEAMQTGERVNTKVINGLATGLRKAFPGMKALFPPGGF
jgi:hypothetical protein